MSCSGKLTCSFLERVVFFNCCQDVKGATVGHVMEKRINGERHNYRVKVIMEKTG